ncbi:hypothetical protein NHX12_021544, partial [Muraenolepis orangiensis]
MSASVRDKRSVAVPCFRYRALGHPKQSGSPTLLAKAQANSELSNSCTGKNNSGVKPVGQCGTWVKEPDGGVFTSPNYPGKYPPATECVYILEAPPRQCIELHFEENYSIESSWECKFDNIEVRDGPFGFSPIMGRYCGQHSPPDIRSSGRYLWIKFVTDGELEAVGFSARYNFTAGNSFVRQ